MKTRNTILFVIVFVFIITIPGFAQKTRDYIVPNGWHFKSALTLPCGRDVIMIWPNTPVEYQYSETSLSRLLIGDGMGNIINDITLDKPQFLRGTKDDRIILMQGKGEGIVGIEVLDSDGTSLFKKPTEGRSPIPALIGKEIGLAEEPLGPGPFLGPISIIDGTTGLELFRMSPGNRGFSGFLPIGENGQFLISIGATIFMKSYKDPHKKIWGIQDIGGNIDKIEPVNDSFIDVQYSSDDAPAHKYHAGVAIINWRSGETVFKEESNDLHSGVWSFLHNANYHVSIEDKNLCFKGLTQGEVYVIPFKGIANRGWDRGCLRKYLIRANEMEPRFSYDRKNIITLHDNKIRLEELTLIPQ